jgi:hypothetical protein
MLCFPQIFLGRAEFSQAWKMFQGMISFEHKAWEEQRTENVVKSMRRTKGSNMLLLTRTATVPYDDIPFFELKQVKLVLFSLSFEDKYSNHE